MVIVKFAISLSRILRLMHNLDSYKSGASDGPQSDVPSNVSQFRQDAEQYISELDAELDDLQSLVGDYQQRLLDALSANAELVEKLEEKAKESATRQFRLTLLKKKYEKQQRQRGLTKGSPSKIPGIKKKSTLDDLSDPQDEDPVESRIYTGFIEELLEHLKTNPKGRNYSITMKETCYVLMSQSMSTYEAFRCLLPLPLPSPRTVRNQMMNDEKRILAALQELSLLPELIVEYVNQYNLGGAICTLAIDACFSTTFAQGRDSTAFFLYLLLPIDSRLKCVPLHVHTAEKGSASHHVHRTILEIAKKQSILIRSLSTDGDPGYNEKFTECHSNLIDSELSYIVNLQQLHDYHQLIYIPDPLHLFKNLRNLIVQDKLTVAVGKDETVLSADEFEQALNLGQPLIDETTHGKMRDYYPQALFTFQNAITLFHAGLYAHAAFVLLISLIAEVIFSIDYSIEVRKFFLIAFIKAAAEMQHSNTYFGGLFSYKRLVKLELLAYTLLDALVSTPDHLAINRFGTHPLENFFGWIRLNCNYDHRPCRIYKAIATKVVSGLRKSDALEETRIRNRVNIAGAKTDEYIGRIGDLPPLETDTIARGIIQLMEGNSPPLQCLITYFEHVEVREYVHRKHVNLTTSQTIMSRSIAATSK